MRPVLIEIQPVVRATNFRETLLFASGASADVYGAGGVPWQPAVVRRPQLSMEILAPDLSGRVQAGRASFALSTRQMGSAHAHKRVWLGAPIKIWFNEDANPNEEPDFVGIISSIDDGTEIEQKVISCTVDLTFLEKPLLTEEFGGTGGADGDAEARGTLKPAGFGAHEGIPPMWFDKTRWIGMIDGYGNTVSITRLMEGLSDFGPRVADYPSYAALAAAIDNETIAPGQWGTCVAEGMVGLGAPPEYPILVNAVFGSNRLGAIIQRVLTEHAGVDPANIQTASFTALDAAVNRAARYWTAEQRDIRNLVEAMAGSANATPFVDFKGKVNVTRATKSAAVATLDRSGNAEPRVVDWQTGERRKAYWRLSARVARPASTIDLNEVNYVDDLVDRGGYKSDEVYRAGHYVWKPDGSSWIYTNDSPTSGNAPPNYPVLSNAYWQNLNPPTDAAELGVGQLGFLSQLDLSNIALTLGELPTNRAVSGLINNNLSMAANGILSGGGGGQVTYDGLGGGALGLLPDLNAGGPLFVGQVPTNKAVAALINANLSIGANGILSGGGGGQVTLGGIGYEGSRHATSGANLCNNPVPSSLSGTDGWVFTFGLSLLVPPGVTDPDARSYAMNDGCRELPGIKGNIKGRRFRLRYWIYLGDIPAEQYVQFIFRTPDGSGISTTGAPVHFGTGGWEYVDKIIYSSGQDTSIFCLGWDRSENVGGSPRFYDLRVEEIIVLDLDLDTLGKLPTNKAVSALVNANLTIGANGVLSGGGGGQVTYERIGGGPLGLLANLNAGGPYFVGQLPTSKAVSGLINSNLSIGSNGILSGGGGGQVTISGLGYVGALDATAETVLTFGSAVEIEGNTVRRTEASSGFGSYAHAGQQPNKTRISQAVASPGSSIWTMIGLDNGFTGTDRASCKFFLQVRADGGSVQLWRDGAQIWVNVPGTVPTTCGLEYDGKQINVLFDGAIIHSVAHSYTGPWVPKTFPYNPGILYKNVRVEAVSVNAEPGSTVGASWNSNLLFRPSNLAALVGSEGINNQLLSIGANGILSGGAGGQVTISGLGYSGSLAATEGENLVRKGKDFGPSDVGGWTLATAVGLNAGNTSQPVPGTTGTVYVLSVGDGSREVPGYKNAKAGDRFVFTALARISGGSGDSLAPVIRSYDSSAGIPSAWTASSYGGLPQSVGSSSTWTRIARVITFTQDTEFSIGWDRINSSGTALVWDVEFKKLPPETSRLNAYGRLLHSRAMPPIVAMNLSYKFTGSVTWSASSNGTGTISVGAGSALVGTAALNYNAMSVGVSGAAGTTKTFQLYLTETDDPASWGGSKTLIATTNGADVYGNDNNVWIGYATVTFPTSGGGSGGGGGGGGGGVPGEGDGDNPIP